MISFNFPSIQIHQNNLSPYGRSSPMTEDIENNYLFIFPSKQIRDLSERNKGKKCCFSFILFKKRGENFSIDFKINKNKHFYLIQTNKMFAVVINLQIIITFSENRMY